VTPTASDLRLVGAYLATGSTKEAARDLGMTDAAYRHRLCRLYRRAGVRNMAALLHALDGDAAQMAHWLADTDPRR
jgi:hypothetical protein